MSAYNYTLRYKSGLSNGNADCLSRFPAHNDSETSKIENVVFLTEVDQSPITSDEVKYYTERDPVVNRVMNYIQCAEGALEVLYRTGFIICFRNSFREAIASNVTSSSLNCNISGPTKCISF